MSLSLFLVCGCLVGHAFLCFCCVGGGCGGIVLLRTSLVFSFYASYAMFCFSPFKKINKFTSYR